MCCWWFPAAFAAIVLHFAFLFCNVLMSWLLRFPETERKAIIVMASQKNLPTAAVIISYFDSASVGNLGLISIPCIVFYIMQLFIDSFIANTWASKYERLSAVEAAYTEQLKQLTSSDGTANKMVDKAAAADKDGQQTQVADRIAAVQEPSAAAAPPPAAAAANAGRQAGAGNRPGRALVQRLSSSGGDVDMGLLQNVELNDVNPLLERS
jgi:sodium/bile acid cotransporter 7